MSKIMDEIGLKIWETSLIPTKIALEIEAKKDKKREQQIIKEKEQKKIKEAEEKQCQINENLRKLQEIEKARKLQEQKEDETKKFQELNDRKKRIESLAKIWATKPISSEDIVGFRKVTIVVDKYEELVLGILPTGIELKTEKKYMELIEVIDQKGYSRYLYDKDNKCSNLQKWYTLSRFIYTPDNIDEIVTALELIIPRFNDIKFYLNLAAPEVNLAYKNKKDFVVADRYELYKKEIKFIAVDELPRLKQRVFKKFFQTYEFWTKVNSAHIFEREPYEFWKKKYKEMDEAIEKEFNRREEIVKAKENEKIIQYGKEGEKKVEYALKWLPKEYAVVDKGEDGIQLQCLAISDEKQEIDHIVISSKGVFLIETKNYAGKIIIDANGNWIREKEDGKQRGIPNPVQQLGRHHLIVQEILGIEDVFDVICIANEGSVIEGIENCPIAIVKFDMLAFYIQQYENNSGNVYSLDDIEKIKEKIDNHRIK